MATLLDLPYELLQRIAADALIEGVSGGWRLSLVCQVLRRALLTSPPRRLVWGSGRIVPSRADQGLDSVLFKHRSATGWQLLCTPHWLRLALKAVTESGFSKIILSECTTCGTLHRSRSVNSATVTHCGDKAVQMIARSLCSEVNQLTSLDIQYKLLGEQAGIAIAIAMQHP